MKAGGVGRGVAFDTETFLALVTSVLLTGPTVVLWAAYRRTRGARIGFAALGFTAFLATDLLLFASDVLYPGSSLETEYVEFVGDILVAALFAAAFLLPVAVRDGRT